MPQDSCTKFPVTPAVKIPTMRIQKFFPSVCLKSCGNQVFPLKFTCILLPHSLCTCALMQCLKSASERYTLQSLLSGLRHCCCLHTLPFPLMKPRVTRRSHGLKLCPSSTLESNLIALGLSVSPLQIKLDTVHNSLPTRACHVVSWVVEIQFSKKIVESLCVSD